ncbi:MAG: ATPase [Dehalococcoidia bacterium]|nr:ATPase [Dehalococcoidia bacterium]
MMTNRELQVSTPSDREILMTREFDAAPQLVYDAWTKPELLKRWFGPPGWELPECEIDLRVGGSWRYLMRKPETGEEMGISGVYREIVAPTLLVTTEKFDQAWYEGDCIDHLEFIDQGGKTLLKLTTLYDTKEVRDAVVASGAAGGMNESFNRLDEVLAEKA